MIEHYQKKLNQHYPEEHLELLESHILSNNKSKRDAKVKCLTCGEIKYYKRLDTLFKSSRKIYCHNCVEIAKKRASFIQSLKDLYPEDDLSVLEFKNKNNAGKIKCNRCGHIYEYKYMRGATEEKRLRNHFCRYCFPYKNIRQTREVFLDWLEKNNQKWQLLEEVPKDVKVLSDLIKCECMKCHKINEKTISDYLHNYKCDCEAVIKNQDDFIKKLDEGYALLSKYEGTEVKVLLKHNCGHIYSVTPHSYIKGSRCPICARHKRQSKGEKAIAVYLKNNNIEFFPEFPVQIENHNLFIDFYLPGYDLYIEYQGQQHFFPIEFFGGEKKFQQQVKYDNLKRNFLKDKLLEISYKDFDNISIILNKTLKFNDYPEKEYITSG